MKNFFKTVLAVIVGMLIMSMISTVMSVIMFAVILAGGSTSPVLPSSGVLKIDMSSIVISEQTQEANPLASMQGGAGIPVGIWDAVQALSKAAEDPGVKFIYLKVDGMQTSLANLEEFRKAIQHFRDASGKPVIAYTESPGTGSYYLASVADKVYMTSYPGASTSVSGVGLQLIFLKDLLDKLGVNMQLIRHGKYKSAGEMYICSEASEANLEQNQEMVNSIWKTVSSDIARSRGIGVDNLNAMIDNLDLCLPEDFLSHGLVDGLLTRDELEAKLTELAGEQEYRKVPWIGFSQYAQAVAAKAGKAKKAIAVIYADGEIIDGSEYGQVAGDRFAEEIEKVRRDSNVKAVVLRVNSPGGSVLASEKIKRELDLLKAEKPLVASYGGYAASGGYWISNGCSKIYSDATTLTGSIGVFGLVPDISGTLKDVAHVNIQSVTSNRHGDMYSLMRPFDSAEYNYMLRSIEDIYDRFTTLVSEGRGMEKEAVDAIGQGRVWTGSDALGIGLVDEIGTLEDAIAYAAILGEDPDIANWKVKGYPAPLSGMELMMSMFAEAPAERPGIKAVTSWCEDIMSGRTGKVFASMPYIYKLEY